MKRLVAGEDVKLVVDAVEVRVPKIIEAAKARLAEMGYKPEPKRRKRAVAPPVTASLNALIEAAYSRGGVPESVLASMEEAFDLLY